MTAVWQDTASCLLRGYRVIERMEEFMQLSKRLAAVADMVTPGLVLADIGTDHAYIPIYLVEQQITPRAIAADVNRGPLARADAHIREHALEGKIETRLSDGLAAFSPGEAQSIVIAGMGGALTIRILENGMKEDGKAGLLLARERRDLEERNPISQTELILQPQSEISLVRSWLEQKGWTIVREDMVFEDGKYYPMMKARQCPACSASMQSERCDTPSAGAETRQSSLPSAMSETELRFGPRLLEMRHPVLYQFLLRERATLENVLRSLELGRGEAACVRKNEVRVSLERIGEALRLYDGSNPD